MARTRARLGCLIAVLVLAVGLAACGGAQRSSGLVSPPNRGESAAVSYAKQISKYRELTQQKKSDAGAWANLTWNLRREAAGESYFNSSGLTSKGRKIFKETARAWSSYFALVPKHPELTLAKEMLRIYGAEGLNEDSHEVSLLQIIAADEPDNYSYDAELAEYAYKAHDTSLGDLASAKALSLSPADDRQQLKRSLEEVKEEIENKR